MRGGWCYHVVFWSLRRILSTRFLGRAEAQSAWPKAGRPRCARFHPGSPVMRNQCRCPLRAERLGSDGRLRRVVVMWTWAEWRSLQQVSNDEAGSVCRGNDVSSSPACGTRLARGDGNKKPAIPLPLHHRRGGARGLRVFAGRDAGPRKERHRGESPHATPPRCERTHRDQAAPAELHAVAPAPRGVV